MISIAMAAVRLTAAGGRVTEARVALGACSPVALRLTGLEKDLIGASLDHLGDLVTADHLGALSPIDDIRAPASYRLDAALTLICRSLTSAADEL